MFLLYVDESGDTGLGPHATPYFVLSGLVIHELRWHATLEALIDFRRHLRLTRGFRLREELHASPFLHHPGELARIGKSIRLRMLRDALDRLGSLPDVSLINIVVDKSGKPPEYDVFSAAWGALITRFHNTMSHRNFPGPRNTDDLGLIVCDQTDEPRLRLLVRRLRKYNPVPSQTRQGYLQIRLTTIAEDAVHRDSRHSYILQFCDVAAFFLYQKLRPCGYLRRKGGANYFDRLDAILCRVASAKDPQGIVRL